MQKLNKLRLFLLVAIICCGTLVAGVVTVRVLTKEKPVRASKSLPPNIGVSLDAARLTDSTNGVKQWEIVARTAQFDKVRNATVLADMKATILSAKSPKVMYITAHTGEYDHDRKTIKLSGGVNGTAPEKSMEFSSPSFVYDTKQKLLKTGDDVTYRDEAISVRGNGFEMSPESGRMHVFRNVEAVVAPKVRKRP